jgi:hypothetical protein
MPDAALSDYGLSPERKRKRGPRSDYETWLRKVGLTTIKSDRLGRVEA